MNNFFGQCLQGDCCLENLYSLHIHVIRPRRQKNNKVVGSIKNMRRSNKVLFLKVLGYRKVRSFKGTLDQFKCVTIETRYHVSIAELLIRNL